MSILIRVMPVTGIFRCCPGRAARRPRVGGFGYSTAVRCFPTMAAESKFLGGAAFDGAPVFPVGARQEAAAVRTWARLLTVDEYGRTEAGNPDTCATAYENRYLLTGVLPRPRTVCKQHAAPFSG